VEQFFDALLAFFGGLFALAQGGFDGVNQVLGLIIAAIAALLMSSWRALWATAAGAALVHILVGVVRPVLDGGNLVLPPILTVGFWLMALALFLGFAIVIAVFFFVKTVLTGTAFRKKAHAH
jgi:hypothetical protein